MRRISLLACLAFVLAGSSAAQTQVGFLAVGDYGVGGSRESGLGQAMKRFEAGHPANWLVTLGDNDYTKSPGRFRASWQQASGGIRLESVREVAEAGVDRISTGWPTHNAPWLDFGLDWA